MTWTYWKGDLSPPRLETTRIWRNERTGDRQREPLGIISVWKYTWVLVRSGGRSGAAVERNYLATMRNNNQRRRLSKRGNWNVTGEVDLCGTYPRWQLISALFPAGECATRCPETPLPTGQVRHGTDERVRAPGTPPAREIFGREGGLSSAAHPPSLGAWAKDVCHDLSGEGLRGTGVPRSQNWPCERTWGTTMREATTAVLTGGKRMCEALARQVTQREG